MRRFAELQQSLAHAPGDAARARLLEGYFRAAPPGDRGWALAVLLGAAGTPRIPPASLRALAEARVDPALFRLSLDLVRDVGETAALIWPGACDAPAPGLAEVVARLRAMGRADRDRVVAELLDALDPLARVALVKLGGAGTVSAALARRALAPIGGLDPADLAAVWHGLAPPYAALFAWLDGGAAPRADPALAFRPLAQALPFEGAAPDLARGDHAVEPLWDGLRVQVAAGAGGRRLYAQAGEDIGAAFPDVLAAMTWHGCVDAVLMVARGDGFAPRAEVEARLRRKKPTRKQVDAQPAVLVAHDLLHDGARDLRALPWHARRAALEGWAADLPPDHLRLSPVLAGDWDAVAARRAARVAGEAGVMIKRRDAPYGGDWLAWRRAPLTARCVLMHAARGPLSGVYSELSFGVWVDGPQGRELLPVGKAAAPGDAGRVDAWVRAHMTERFGPVRGVAPELVLEVSFDGFAPAPRRKAGVAMRGAAIRQVLWDASAAEADALDALLRMDGMDGAGRGRA